MNRQVLYGPGTPGIRLSAGLAGSTRQKAREVYSNRLVHAMPNSQEIKCETLAFTVGYGLIAIRFESSLADRYPIGVDFEVSGVIFRP